MDSWCVISNEKKCFILASKGNDICQLVVGSSPQLLKLPPNVNLQFGSITKMQPSFNADMIAFATDTSHIITCTNDLTRVIHKYGPQSSSQSSTNVKHLAWVSSKAIVAFWDSLILIPFEVSGDQQQQQQQQSHFEIYYSEPIYLVL